jgi:hypothetical protein
VRSSVLLLLVSLAGIMGGAALIGVWALGLAIIADSVAVGVYALLHDDGVPAQPAVRAVPRTVAEVLEHARAAS